MGGHPRCPGRNARTAWVGPAAPGRAPCSRSSRAQAIRGPRAGDAAGHGEQRGRAWRAGPGHRDGGRRARSDPPPVPAGPPGPGLSSTYGLTGRRVRPHRGGRRRRARRRHGRRDRGGTGRAARDVHGQGRAFAVGGRGSGLVRRDRHHFPGHRRTAPGDPSRPPSRGPGRTPPRSTSTTTRPPRWVPVRAARRGHGAGGTFFGLAPVAPGLYLGGVGMAQAQPWPVVTGRAAARGRGRTARSARRVRGRSRYRAGCATAYGSGGRTRHPHRP